MVEKETQRLEWLSTNHLRPEEFINNMTKSNEKLVKHLENLDNSFQLILNGQGSLYEGIAKKKSLWNRLGFGGKRQPDESH